MNTFRKKTTEVLSSLTLAEYQEKKVEELVKKYKTAPVTIQKFARNTFHVARKQTPSKLGQRYGDLDWSKNDTFLAKVLVKKRKIENSPKNIRNCRERVRQLRQIFNKPQSPEYRKR